MAQAERESTKPKGSSDTLSKRLRYAATPSSILVCAFAAIAVTALIEPDKRNAVIDKYISQATPEQTVIRVTNESTPTPPRSPTPEAILALRASPKPSPDSSAPFGAPRAEAQATQNAIQTATPTRRVIYPNTHSPISTPTGIRRYP